MRSGEGGERLPYLTGLKQELGKITSPSWGHGMQDISFMGLLGQVWLILYRLNCLLLPFTHHRMNLFFSEV